MPRKKSVEVVEQISSGSTELVNALVQAIEATRPVSKKNAVNRTASTPWTPKDGSPKLKLKRKMSQHGQTLDADILFNEEIELLNKVRPGVFLEGAVRVTRRKDKGIDIDYSVKTASNRLKLVNQFGIRNFTDLLARCIYEAENPTKFTPAGDE